MSGVRGGHASVSQRDRCARQGHLVSQACERSSKGGSSSVDREKSAVSVLNKLVEGSTLQLDSLLRDAVTDEMCETGRWASLSRLFQEQNGNLPSQ